MSAFVCTGCGGGSVEVNVAHPSLDERYPIGHCITCTPWPRPKPNPLKPSETIQPPRRTIALIRADLFDRPDFDHRRKVAEARRLAGKLHGPKAARMSQAELQAASEAAGWLRREG